MAGVGSDVIEGEGDGAFWPQRSARSYSFGRSRAEKGAVVPEGGGGGVVGLGPRGEAVQPGIDGIAPQKGGWQTWKEEVVVVVSGVWWRWNLFLLTLETCKSGEGFKLLKASFPNWST